MYTLLKNSHSIHGIHTGINKRYRTSYLQQFLKTVKKEKRNSFMSSWPIAHNHQFQNLICVP